MSLTRELLFPLTKIKNNFQKEISHSSKTNIINLILKTHSKFLLIFKHNDKNKQKLVLTKKGFSSRNIKSKNMNKNIINNDKILLKSKSVNKNIFKKIKHNKTNSSFLSHNKKFINEIINTSYHHQNNKTEIFSKLTKYKSTKRNCSSRNKSFCEKSTDINKILNRINKNKIPIENKKIKLTKLNCNKINTNYIPKYKSKLKVDLYISQRRNHDINNKNKSKRIRKINGQLNEKKISYINNDINITDKENMNLTNINTNTNINVNISLNEKILFPMTRKKSFTTKLNLPFSPNSNKNEYFKQIKNKKKYLIKNSKNDINIPFDDNKNKSLLRQNSYYNLINYRKKRNQKINIKRIDSIKDEDYSLIDKDFFDKNNSKSSFDLNSKKDINYFSNINSNIQKCLNHENFENNNEIYLNDNNYEVETNHFRIVKFIQESKFLMNKIEYY